MSSENIKSFKGSYKNNLKIKKITISENYLDTQESNKSIFNKKTFLSKKVNLFPSSIFLLLLFLIFFMNFTQSKTINNKLRLLEESKHVKEKKNVIKLKFNCKNPKNPVQLFNSSSEIQNHIELLEVGGTVENITDSFYFGFSGKYQVKIRLKDKLTSIKNLFSGCSQLIIADFSDFISDEVTDMAGLFQGCLRLKYVEFGNFNTQKVMNMENMFSGCKSLDDLNLTSFDTSNVYEWNVFGMPRIRSFKFE